MFHMDMCNKVYSLQIFPDHLYIYSINNWHPAYIDYPDMKTSFKSDFSQSVSIYVHFMTFTIM